MVIFFTSCASDGNDSGISLTTSGDVPPVLLRIDEKAEQIVAAVREDDWPRADVYTNDINDAWVDYENPTLDGHLGDALAELKYAAAQRNSPATLRAANNVSAAAVDLYEYYHPAIPPDLRRLEILEGRILIDLGYNAIDSISATLSRANSVWQRLRPIVLAHTDEKAVQTVGHELDLQKAALAVHDLTRLTSSTETTITLINDIQSTY